MIGVQAKRLAELVEEILVAGQLDSGTLRVVTEPFDPEELVWAQLRPRAFGPATTGNRRVVPAVVPLVRGDPERTDRCSPTSSTTRSSTRLGGRIEVGVEAERQARAVLRPRRGSRHPAGRAGADLREVLSPRSRSSPRHRRHRPRPLHLPRARPLDGRQDLGRLGSRPRGHVRVRDPARRAGRCVGADPRSVDPNHELALRVSLAHRVERVGDLVQG